jgi:hypothetical protein
MDEIDALLPHSREDCDRISFDIDDPTKICENCFCYVCNIPAKDCNNWESHCHVRSEQDTFTRPTSDPVPSSGGKDDHREPKEGKSLPVPARELHPLKAAAFQAAIAQDLLGPTIQSYPYGFTPLATIFKTELKDYQVRHPRRCLKHPDTRIIISLTRAHTRSHVLEPFFISQSFVFLPFAGRRTCIYD